MSSIEKPFFKDNDFTLYLAESIEFLSKMQKESVDMIFADPPYFLSSGSFTCQNGKMVSVKKGDWDLSNGVKQNFDFHFEWINACKNVLKPDGSIWISGTYHSIYQCGYALQLAGFHMLNDIVWYKPNASPNLSCRYFTASHETLLWARKDKKAKHKFNYETMVNWENNYAKPTKCSKCGANNMVEILHEKGKQMRSLWGVNTPKKSEKKFGKHPTQKPEELLKRVILASTDEGDLILDPFTGSSTTGIVASMYNRKFIGIDSNEEYLELSKKRYKDQF